MSKRIYEFAKEHNKSSREILEIAEKQGLEFASHMSSIDKEQQRTILDAMGNKTKQPSSKKETAQKPAEDAKENQSKQKRQNQANEQRQYKEEKADRENERSQRHQQKKNKQNANATHQDKEQSGSQEGGSRRRRRRGGRRGRNQQNEQKQSSGITERKHKDLPESFEYTEGMNIQDIAKIFHRDATEIIMKLMGLGVMANQNQALSKDVIELIALEYGVEATEKEVIDIADLDRYFEPQEDEKPEDRVKRPAVVTIMGHVDHGKTTLLDTLRSAQVASGEAGGITQHIGAYQVKTNGEVITFLDTPGHEAFTTMRARGANITDIAIIVVAADDGVMPQTVEAINHAKAAKVPIIIAVNKIDLPTANPDRVMTELADHGIISEAWGGDNIFVQISAKQNINIDELLEMIILVADMEELKANPKRRAVGSVIEARLDRATGATVTLLVQDGTLRVGDPIVVGETYGRVRSMTNDQGRRIKEAKPSTPVEITGLNGAPQAGDLFAVFEDEKSARHAGEERAQRAQERHRQSGNKVTLDNLFETLQQGELKTVNVIVKADVQGSAEALAASLQKIEVEGVRVDIVHRAVGGINESDVTLANASGAIIIGFNVRPTPQAAQQAKEEDVDIRTYRVIYDAINEIETAMKGMLDPEYEEEVQGQAIVRETYTVSKLGTIAGSFVTNGYFERSSKVRLIRNNVIIFDGEIASLRRYQDDVRRVDNGYEFGIMLDGFNDIKIDDVLESYHMVEIKK